MKGRRKAKTDKWLLMAQFAKDARLILVHTASATTRLYPTAAQTTIEEPVGLLAGSREGLPQSASGARKRKGSEQVGQ